MPSLAIIPARGGSKRIPRKNIKDFLDKPIIAYSIELALKSRIFDDVVVSTDDEEIATIARQYGANVPFLRSEEKSDDFSSVFTVIDEVLAEYEKKFNKKFDNVCLIFPTAPFITPERLIEGYNILIDSGVDQVLPVVAFSYPIWRGLSKNDQDCVEMKWQENLNVRSQDLEEIFHDSGQWYWFKSDIPKSNFLQNNKVIVLSQLEVQDIDNLDDWAVAEVKFKLLKKDI